MNNEEFVFYQAKISKIVFEIPIKLYEMDPAFVHSVFVKIDCSFVWVTLIYTLKRSKSRNLKVQKVGNERVFHLNIRSIDYHFEELEMLLDTFLENKPSILCCFETWITESSPKSSYSAETSAPKKFDPGSTRNEGLTIDVQELLYIETLELSI